MTFCLVHREIADLTRHLSSVATSDFQGKESLIAQTEISLNEKYLKHVDSNQPSHAVIVAFVEVKLSSLKLSILHQQSKVNDAQQTR